MTPAWAQRREELLSDCMVSPDVFQQMVDRLGAFVVPYQHALETEAGQRNVHLYLQGLLSHLPGKATSGGGWSTRSVALWMVPRHAWRRFDAARRAAG